jgi:hypothetical protein
MQQLELYCQNLLSVYKKETRFLSSFSLVNDIGYADFSVNSDFYSGHEKMAHFTAPQFQICLNQLLFVYIAATGKYEKLFAQYNYSSEYIQNFQNNNTFITKQNCRFCKQIDTKETIPARMKIIREKQIRKLNLLELEFDFYNGCCTGEVTVAIVAE